MSWAARFNSRTWTQYVGLLFRIGLGAILVYAGYIKVIDLDNAKRSVIAYRLFPYSLAQTIGVVMPIIEIALGVLLILGLFTRIVGSATAILMVIYIAGIVSVWARHISINCGCLSGGGPVPNWDDAVRGYKVDIVRDIGFLLMAAWLAWFPRTAWSLDRWLKGSAAELDEPEVDDNDESVSVD